MRAWVVGIVVAAACSHEPSAADKERATAAAACTKGEATACFVAGSGLDYTDQAQLARAIEYWTRGCELGHGASCAQLGSVAEFGMTTGGQSPDPQRAHMYYALACKQGHADSCTRAGMPDAAATKAKRAFAWRDALAPILGQHPAELGSLFRGLVPGQPMPAAMAQSVAAFEKTWKAHVHYYAGDPAQLSAWSLDVTFDADGILSSLRTVWGAPQRAFGAWTNDDAHLIAYWMHPSGGSGVSWTAYRSVAEVIRPDDTTRLGIEPIPVIGATVADLRAAPGTRLLGPDEYGWLAVGPGPAFEVHAIAKAGAIVELRTVNWITNDPAVGDALFAALEAKWGPPRIGKDGVHTWLLPGRSIKAAKPASGNFEIVMRRR